ncbi:helix-turn-helix domain-containing protein [Fibrella forsythiae]|uniref:DDE-type integrase/transposase/recombinase n=1 Tax=Fibrella forsythiae TaxID=2817061 RepID=A0ABS3JRL2_9BACT|nr:helix-turn-helix domain-containing protein [Fibrella forsythiae]MBO0952629.1 DDE-type integrase/transposase/recombinase [Fibrella forsythiae]
MNPQIVNQIYITPGAAVDFEGDTYQVKAILDDRRILAHRVIDDHIAVLQVTGLTPSVQAAPVGPEIQLADEEAWALATRRYNLIKPILANRSDGALVKAIAKENRVSVSTLYRWLERYERTGLVSALMDYPRDGGKGKNRLSPEVEVLIEETIRQEYLSVQRKPISKVYQSLVSQCRQAGLEEPHPNTVRNRVRQLTEYTRLRFRYGKPIADEQLAPLRGNFPGADFPLAVVQIDHTKLDLILVDNLHRQPLGRPWITLAIDVFSRMVVGFYVSFDPPGAMGTGLCIANAILPKETLLASHNLGGEWPCWGVMRMIHLDNAKEFRGTMIKRACEEYGIELNWRPVARPQYGGHIERLLGTVAREMHTLPGTTFSNTRERGRYPSEQKATMTLDELEKWLLTYVTEVYHKRIHSSLGTSPLEYFRQGLLGRDGQSGTGLPFRTYNPEKVRLDFMPFEERTVQEYGVLIDHIYYYADVLRRWIKTTDPTKYKHRLKMLFKRDPRDVSIIYFYDPELKAYFPIPYRDTSRPPMSIWEHREALKRAREQQVTINEDSIFAAYEAMRQIEEAAGKLTKQVRRKGQRQPVHEARLAALTKSPAQPSLAAEHRQFDPFDSL